MGLKEVKFQLGEKTEKCLKKIIKWVKLVATEVKLKFSRAQLIIYIRP